MEVMRAKLKVVNIEALKLSSEDESKTTQENLTFSAVCRSEGYPEDGSDENNTYAKWTPTADLQMIITNPALFGKFKVGDEFYVPFIKAN